MSICFEIREDKELAVWQGLGGAITEATAYNFSKLSKAKQKELLKAYYDKDGHFIISPDPVEYDGVNKIKPNIKI